MNILHVVLSLETGGLERVVLDLIHNSSSNLTSYLCCLDEVGGHRDELHSIGIDYWELENYGINKVETFKKIKKIVIGNKIDIIHTHNPSPHFYGALVGFICGIPVVHTKHGRNYPSNKWLVYKNYILSFFSYKVVCVSSDVANVALDIERVSVAKVVTILNGIDTYKYSNPKSIANLKALGVKEDSFVIGIVARLSVEKDHNTLLDALSLIVSKTPKIRLLIVGDGPLRYVLEKRVDELKLGRHCCFLGNRSDVPELLSAINLFVLSSTTEGVSLTLLEAMSASLPIVCTDVGGNREVVVDSITGIIVPPQDPQAFADAVIELIKNPAQLTQMGKEGKKRVESFFSVSRAAREYEKLYCEAT